MIEPSVVSRLRSAALRYGLAVASVAAAALVSSPLGRQLVADPLERLIDAVTLLHAAVVLSAWLGGIGPGLLAAVLAVLTIDYFVTPPLYDATLDLHYLPRLALIALSALLVGWLGVRRRRTADALQHAHDELDARVRERTADLARSNQQLHDEIAARKQAQEAFRAKEDPHAERNRKASAEHWFQKGLELEQSGAADSEVIGAYQKALELDPKSAGAPGVVTMGRAIAMPSSTLFWMPRAMRSGATTTAAPAR